MLQTRRVNINGKAVRMLCGGTGKPMMFLHGWSTNPPAHHESLELLAKNFTIYVPFLYDFRFRNLADMARGVEALIRQLGLKNVILAGTSFGALVAAVIAESNNKNGSIVGNRYNELSISRLILVNPAGVPNVASVVDMFFDSLKSFTLLLLTGKLRTIRHRAASGLSFHLSFIWNSGFRDLSKEVTKKVHACHLFSNIKIRTSIIWSDNDVTFPYAHAEVLHKMIKNSTVKIVKGDHAWHYHNPELFAKTIMEACNSA